MVVSFRGGATVLKVGGQKVIRERSEWKIFFLYPPHLEKWGGTIFLHVGGTSKQTTISIEYTEICCLVVALINMS